MTSRRPTLDRDILTKIGGSLRAYFADTVREHLPSVMQAQIDRLAQQEKASAPA